MNHIAGSDISRRPEAAEIEALARTLHLCLERPLGRHAWLGRTQAGRAVVLKNGPGASGPVCDFLTKCQALFPAFAYPRIVAARPEAYLLYDYLAGEPVSLQEFEAEESRAAAFEVSGRITALCRSLRLAPLFQGFQAQAAAGADSPGAAARRLASLSSGLAGQVDGLAIRRWEASRSYAWAQGIIPHCAAHWPDQDDGLEPRWPALQQRVERITSIHLNAPGSLMAHTCFTPEHLLATPAGWGVIGWRVAPRPYNYMRYRYLAWCLVHTRSGDIEARYRAYLADLPAVELAAANSLTLVLGLLESWLEAGPGIARRAEKLQTLISFIDETLALPVADAPG